MYPFRKPISQNKSVMNNLDLIPPGFFGCFPDPPCLFHLNVDPFSLLYNPDQIEFHVYMDFTFLSHRVIITFLKCDFFVSKDKDGNLVEEWLMKTIRESSFSKNKETVMLITRHRVISKREERDWRVERKEVKVHEYRESKLNEMYLGEIFSCRFVTTGTNGLTREELLKIIERRMWVNAVKEEK